MSTAGPGPSGSTLLIDAYKAAYQTSDVGRIEKRIDGVVENINAKSESPTFSFLNDFYSANESTISSAAAGLSSLDNKTIENAISKFSETVKVVIGGLDALAAVHPFVGVAVLAFKLVVTLDLTRRENNGKVIALRVQMQNTMCVLFQLRHMRDPEESGLDGITIKDRMQPLIERIAKSIQECGAACDAYLKKSFLSRTLKCKIYESRLATWATTFADYRAELEHALSVHTAVGVDQANRKLDNQQATLKNIESTMVEIFHKLDTPREREIAKFMEENGGARACIESNDLLTKLVSKSGESMSTIAGRSAAKGVDDLASARKTLLKELSEDVDQIFKKNLAVFEAKMAIQRQQITEVMEKQGRQIMSVLLSGSHVRIRDADLQRLWKEMGWKGSVKGRHFVLALRDYFTDQFNEKTVPTTPQIAATGLPTPSPNSLTPAPTADLDDDNLLHNPVNASDRWTLEHLNVAQLQPILEAIDDDGTGFISIKEANTFAIQRPKGWTLLHWLAFWGKGWHHSLSRYKNQIYLFIQEMHRDLESIKADNKLAVDWYLDGDYFRTIEQLLRSTKLPDENEQLGSDLAHITDLYVKSEEERLERNLKSVGYNIDSPGTVSLITGQSRIERHVYPLLFLVLRHHVRIIKVAKEHILHEEELDYWAESLKSIISVVKNRVEALGAIYKQTYADVRVRLENFAFGMYGLIWDSPDVFRPVDNSFASWEDISTDRAESQIDDYSEEDLHLLHFDHQDTFSYTPLDVDLPPLNLDSDSIREIDGLGGVWAGHCYHTESDGDRISVKGLMMLRITSIEDGNIKGQMESCWGIADFTGNAQGSEDSDCEVTFTLPDAQGGDVLYNLTGTFDPVNQTISGTYEIEGEDDEGDSDEEGGEDDEESEDDDEEEEGGDEEKVCEGEGADEEDGGVEQDNEADGREDQEAENKEVKDQGSDEDNEEWEDVEEGEENVNPGDGDTGRDDEGQSTSLFTFILRRTPPELYRFRCTDEEHEKNAARARWRFACDAVLFYVRKRLWSWSYFKDRMAERKRVVELRTRGWRSGNNLAPDTSLDPEEQKELDRHDDTLTPSMSGFLDALLQFSDSREQCIFAICYNCEKPILNPGWACLQCVPADLIQGIYLCPDCLCSSIDDDDYTHDETHSMLKTSAVIHDYRVAFLFRETRALVERVKPALRDIETNRKGSHSEVKPKGKKNKYICACCNEPVTTPCYVCAECARDTFICSDCDSKGANVLPDGPAPLHELSHITARIFNTDEEIFEQDPADKTIKRLEGVEKSVHERVDVLEERLKKLEEKMDGHFSKFETLLKQLIGAKGST